jgi:hypothetical protein
MLLVHGRHRRPSLILTTFLLGTNLGQPKVQNLGMTSPRDKNVGRLDVTMHDAFRMRRVECVRHFDAQCQQCFQFHGAAGDRMLQRLTLQILHGDEGLPALLIDLVDCADVGMVQCGSGLRLALEATERLRVLGHFVRQELQGDEAAKFNVLGFVDHAHAATAKFLHNAVVRDGLADHCLAGH